MRNKQGVYYRTCGDKFLHQLSKLPHSVGKVFLALLDVVDIKDNCVQKTFPEVVKENGWDRGNAHKALQKLRKEDMVRDVVDIHGEDRIMIDPRLVWSTKRDSLRFHLNMFLLGSHQKSWEHHLMEEEACGIIDVETGVLVSEYQNRYDAWKRYLKDQEELAMFLETKHSKEGLSHEFYMCIAGESLDFISGYAKFNGEFLG